MRTFHCQACGVTFPRSALRSARVATEIHNGITIKSLYAYACSDLCFARIKAAEAEVERAARNEMIQAHLASLR